MHLLPKLRCYFAEFLNKGSLTRLGILTLSTCVGLRYGHPQSSLEVFLGSMESTTLRVKRLSYSPLGSSVARIYLSGLPTSLNQHFQSLAGLSFCVTPSLITRCWWYGNINPFSIVYAFRPRLRCRLTLGGRAFPRKPWTYGEEDSHLLYRYLCLQSLFCAVHEALQLRFKQHTMLPYQSYLNMIPQLR